VLCDRSGAVEMAGMRVQHQLEAGGGKRAGAAGRYAVLAGLGLLLVAVVGLGSGRPLWDVGGPPGLVDPGHYSGDLVVVAFALLAILPLVVPALRRRRRRAYAKPEPDVPRTRLPWWGQVLTALVAAGAVLLALQLLRLLPGGETRRVQPPARHARQAGDAAASAAQSGLSPVHWWGLGIVVLLLIAGTAIAWLRRERRPAPAPEPEEDLIAAVDLSLGELETEPDPRQAVIRAYARMERVLAAHGLARRPAETPLEHLGRALGSLRVGRPAIERLSALFERAKFSQHEIDWSMRTDALDALATLRGELTGVST
jgi:hypothetical protein